MQPSPLALDGARNAIEQYEVALDAALAVRDEALDSAIAPLLRAMSASDANSGVAAQEAIMQKRVVVRGAQEAGIAAIRDALGGEYGPAFERRALEKSFPQVFRPDPITPLIEGAQALPDLTDDQKTQLSALSTQYGFDLNGVRSALVDAYKVAEPSEPRRRTELARQKAEGQTVRLTDAPQVEQAKKAREDLYEKYRNLLAGILSPEQRTAVPGFVKESPGDAEKEAAVREEARAIRAAQGGGGGGGGGTQGLRGDPSGGKPSNEKPQQPGRPADSGFGANPPTVPPKSVD